MEYEDIWPADLIPTWRCAASCEFVNRLAVAFPGQCVLVPRRCSALMRVLPFRTRRADAGVADSVNSCQNEPQHDNIGRERCAYKQHPFPVNSPVRWI